MVTGNFCEQVVGFLIPYLPDPHVQPEVVPSSNPTFLQSPWAMLLQVRSRSKKIGR
jgi:hypothetical protein